jgi:hypothetical protein
MKQHNRIISDTYTISANQCIGMSYTRKEKLRELVYNTYGNSSIATANKLNIFVDLYSVLHGLYSENNRIVIDNVTDISSSIINLCAHYRSFFRDPSLGVDTRIFLINSTNTCSINRKFVGEYNSTFFRKTQVTDSYKLIRNNMKLLNILCPYLPAIYYIESEQQYETSVIIAYLIEMLNDSNPNLIISHDMYPLQLCTQYKWTSYLYPKKIKDAKGELTDISWMIPVNDKDNFRYEFWNNFAKHRKLSEKTVEKLYTISPINYHLLISMHLFPERNLRSILDISNIIKFISHIAGDQDIKIQPMQFITDNELAYKYPVAAIESRYKAMDVQYMLPFYKSSPEAKNIRLLDLNDIATVNTIVSKYYANNPIDLQHL